MAPAAGRDTALDLERVHGIRYRPSSRMGPGLDRTCVKMTTNPWAAGVLPRKFIELVGVA